MNYITNLEFQRRKENFKNACGYCGKKFDKRKLLLRHQATHNDLKAFECADCLKHFKSKSTLQRHQIHSHRGIKNHKCNECNASFAQYSNLKTHLNRLHSGKQARIRNYDCPNCSCVFTRLNTLNRHIAARHAQKTSLETEMLKDDTILEDPNELAQFVVAQLKSLEKEISCPSNTVLLDKNSQDNENNEQHLGETTCVDMATISQVAIIDRLNPEGVKETINVQTVKRPKERLAFVCEHCAKEFKKPYNFIRHLRTHNSKRPYKCSICVKRFGTKSQLQAHSERMHILDEKTGFLSNKHDCFMCNLSFDSLRQLDIHMRLHACTHIVTYLCSICNAQFSTMTAFSKHKHNTEDATMEMLEQLIPEPIILGHTSKNSFFEESVQQNFHCNSCELLLRSEDALKKHINHHNMIKKFKCNLCGRSYSSKLSLSVHQRVHKKLKPFSCSICDTSHFTTISQLRRHILHVHNNIRNVLCAYCPKTFKNKAHCKSHMKTHLKRLIKTNEVDENLTTPSSRKAKAIVQTKNTTSATSKFVEIELLTKCSKHKHQNFQINVLDQAQATCTSVSLIKSQHNCPHCTKNFQKPSDLNRHIRTHTEERPFECGECKKKFKLKSTLEDHQKTHQKTTERKRPSCQVCGKSYASPKSLSLHLRLHTGALPFKCDFCGKAFRTSGHRLSHMRATKAENGQCKKINSLESIFSKLEP